MKQNLSRLMPVLTAIVFLKIMKIKISWDIAQFSIFIIIIVFALGFYTMDYQAKLMLNILLSILQ